MHRYSRSFVSLTVAFLTGWLLVAPRISSAQAQYNFTTIDVPDSTLTASAGNSTTSIVGLFDDVGGNTHGFLLSKGIYTTLDVPGAMITIAETINNAGVIVGLYVDASGTDHGFVLIDGVYSLVDVPGSLATDINSINENGEIVGSYDDATGTHGFVGKPVH